MSDVLTRDDFHTLIYAAVDAIYAAAGGGVFGQYTTTRALETAAARIPRHILRAYISRANASGFERRVGRHATTVIGRADRKVYSAKARRRVQYGIN